MIIMAEAWEAVVEVAAALAVEWVAAWAEEARVDSVVEVVEVSVAAEAEVASAVVAIASEEGAAV